MIPLVVMAIAWAAFRAAGAAGFLDAAASTAGALRLALAVMFAFTALSHFLPRTRGDLVRMVPPALPSPGLLVTVTGIFEMLGAVGLLIPQFAPASAWALLLLLVALLPANIHAARTNLQIAGRPATPLAIRIPLQAFWIGALWLVARS